jgi:serine/threonine protein kinase
MTVVPDFDSAVELLRVGAAADIFGVDAARAYRDLAKLVHPDRVRPDQVDAATAAFARLSALWSRWQRAAIIETRTATYHVGERLGRDMIADYREATTDGRGVVLKIARHPTDNDLLRREAEVLPRLRSAEAGRFAPYLPELLDSFTHRDEHSRADHLVNVLDCPQGMVSLAAIRAAFPDGLDPRDVAWMWRRLLVALGVAHRSGVVHGSVVPDHILIQAAEHGLVLTNWCFAAIAAGEPVPAIVGPYRDWYPPEIAKREPATPGSDIYLATRCMLALMGDRAPDALTRFARGCLRPSPVARPDDAWRLLDELDAVLGMSFGPRRFRPFAIPATVPAWPR